ncbi:MAG: hypothetical protein EBZ51_10150, partial [Synechococcaceae bacterium WB9_2_112]|nr:hypothetical protein [Synechococcaceae bacterium WB9_2_112]
MDSPLAGASVTLQDAAAGDQLHWTMPAGAGINASSQWDPATTGGTAARVLHFSGIATPELYRELLASITYTSNSATPWRRDPADPTTSRTDVQLTWTVDDGLAAPVAATSSLRFINLKPEITRGSGHQPGSTDPLAIDALLQVSDADTTQMASARVTIEDHQIGDRLLWDTALAASRGLTVTFNPASGTLNVSGIGTVEAYQALLRTIRYGVDWGITSNPAANSSTRSIAWQVTDANSDARGPSSSNLYRTTIQLASIAATGANLNASASLVEDNGVNGSAGPFASKPALPLFNPGVTSISRSGQLAINDSDFGQAQFSTEVSDWTGLATANLGTLSIDASGHWTYTLDNTHPLIQALKAGDQRVESFLVQSLDGTGRQRVDITINGTSDTLVQYASRVLDVSSQGKDPASDVYRRWYANQALGAPNSDFGDFDTAWSPRRRNSDNTVNPSWPDEYIQLGFSRSVLATGARIHETAGLGFVRAVFGFVVDDTGHKTFIETPLWVGTDDAASNEASPGVLELSFADPPQLINGLEILVDIDHTSFWEQIDAVELIGVVSDASYQVQSPTIDEIAGDNAINLAEKTAGVMLSGSYDQYGSTAVEVRWNGKTHTAELNQDQGLWWLTIPSGDIPADSGASTLEVQAFDRSDPRSGDRFGSAVVTATVSIDTVAPTQPTLAVVANDNAINQYEKYLQGVLLSGTAEPLSSVEIAWDYKKPLVVSADALGNWSLLVKDSLIPVDNPDSTLVLTAIDAAGNRSTPLQQQVLIDTREPLKATINPLHWSDSVNAAQKAAGVV